MTTETPVQSTDRSQEVSEAHHAGSVVDVVEKADELMIFADMPGVKPETIDVDFEDRTLTIHGRVEPRQGAKTTYLLQEYFVGDFHRVFQVSEMIEATKIAAEYTNGVLMLHLPKVEAAKPRKIEVQVK